MKSRQSSDALWTSSRSRSRKRVKSWRRSLRTKMRSPPATSQPIRPAERSLKERAAPATGSLPVVFPRAREPRDDAFAPDLNFDLRLLVQHHVQQRAVHVNAA